MPWFGNKPTPINVLFLVIGVAYPVLIYSILPVAQPAVIVGCLIALLVVRLAFRLGKTGASLDAAALVLTITVVTGLFVGHDSLLAIKVYPVAINCGLAMVFGVSLIRPPTIIERIARLGEPELDEHGISYTRTVTKVWVCFFIVNGSISAWTAVAASLEVWTIYNGFIAYLLIGGLFAVEFTVRQIVRRRRTVKS